MIIPCFFRSFLLELPVRIQSIRAKDSFRLPRGRKARVGDLIGMDGASEVIRGRWLIGLK